jgi:hypothetical protein
MTTKQGAQNTASAFAEKVRERLLVWTEIVADARHLLSIWLRRVAGSKRKSTWVTLVIVLAANIVAFNYYQERITRYYLSVLLANLVRMNGDVDALEGKISQLGKKTDELSAKLGNPAPASSPVISMSPASNSPRPRRR